jgi:hypothetical protein
VARPLPGAILTPQLLVVADSTILLMKNLHLYPTMCLDADKPVFHNFDLISAFQPDPSVLKI